MLGALPRAADPRPRLSFTLTLLSSTAPLSIPVRPRWSLPQVAAAPCAPADVSIVQDNVYNDMTSSYVQVILMENGGKCA